MANSELFDQSVLADILLLQPEFVECWQEEIDGSVPEISLFLYQI